MNVKRVIFAVALLTLSVVAVLAKGSQESAATVLSGLRAKMASAPSVDAVFTINAGSGPVQGSVTLAGTRYHMTTPQLSVWYDGRTQWTMLASTSEVSISEPDKAELLASNPFAILNDVNGHFDIRRLSDSNGRRRVELVPRDKNTGIAKYVIYVNPTTKWPAALVVHFDDGRKVDVTFDKITAGKKTADSVFRFDARRYPAAEVIDLR